MFCVHMLTCVGVFCVCGAHVDVHVSLCVWVGAHFDVYVSLCVCG